MCANVNIQKSYIFMIDMSNIYAILYTRVKNEKARYFKYICQKKELDMNRRVLPKAIAIFLLFFAVLSIFSGIKSILHPQHTKCFCGILSPPVRSSPCDGRLLKSRPTLKSKRPRQIFEMEPTLGLLFYSQRLPELCFRHPAGKDI